MKLIEASLPLYEINTLSMYEMSHKAPPLDVKQALTKLLGKEFPASKLPKIHNIHYYPARIPTWGARAVTLASIMNFEEDFSIFLKILGFEKFVKHINLKEKFTIPFVVNPEKHLLNELLSFSPVDAVVIDPMAGGGSIPLESLRLGFTTIAGDINPVSYLLLKASIEFPAKYGSRLFNLLLSESKKLIEYVKSKLGKYYSPDEKQTVYVLGIKHNCGGIMPIVSATVLSKTDKIFFTFEALDGKIRAKLAKEAAPPIFKCPHCGAPISQEILRREWVRKHKNAISKLIEGQDISNLAEELYIPVAVVGRRGYRELTEEERMFQVKACKELSRQAKKDDDFYNILPTSQIPTDNTVFEEVLGIGLTHWHTIFAPRQLLALYLIGKYIRQRAKQLYSEYDELGVAVALYLALTLTKTFNYNNLLTQWDASAESIRDLVGSQYALNRSASLGYDFIDAALPNFGLLWALEIDTAESGKFYRTAGGILPVIKILCDNLEDLWKEGKDAIYLWDATKLSANTPEVKADLIHVDPPYYDQHNYAGIMEFFWQLLQRALLPVLDVLFAKDRTKLDWSPYQADLPRQEIRGPPPKKVGELSKFGDEMEAFFKESLNVLKPDGMLVMWYTYGRIEGWEELFYRLFKAGMQVMKCWQIWSQSPQRRIAIQGSAFFTSMVIVAEHGATRTLISDTGDPRFTEAVTKSVGDCLTNTIQRHNFKMFKEATVMAFADAISAATRFEILGATHELQYRTNFLKLKDEALKIAVNAYLKKLAELFQIKYFPVEALDNPSKLYLLLMLVSDEQFRIPYDFSNRLSQILGLNFKYLAQNRGGNKWFLLPPTDVGNLFSTSTIAEAVNLINEVSRAIEKYGERAAEEVIRKFSRDAIAYAHYMIFFGGDKLIKAGLINLELKPRLDRVIGGFT